MTARDRLQELLGQMAVDEEDAMVVKWLCIVEVMDPDGQRQLWNLESAGLGMHEQIGMLEFRSRCLVPEPDKYEDE